MAKPKEQTITNSSNEKFEDFVSEISKQQTQTNIKEKVDEIIKPEQKTQKDVVELPKVLKAVTKKEESSKVPLVEKNEEIKLNVQKEDKSLELDESSNLLNASIKQANHLKVAQERINELESTVAELTNENEKLSLECEKSNSKFNELSEEVQNLETKLASYRKSSPEGSSANQEIIVQKNQKINELQTTIESLESKLNNENYNKRSHERELENRLELLKSEKKALLKEKDSTILSYKREVDKLSFSINNFKNQQKDLKSKIQNSEARITKCVRTLRTALGILEGTDEQ